MAPELGSLRFVDGVVFVEEGSEGRALGSDMEGWSRAVKKKESEVEEKRKASGTGDLEKGKERLPDRPTGVAGEEKGGSERSERRNYLLSSKDGFGRELSLKHSTVTTPRCGRKERNGRDRARRVRDQPERRIGGSPGAAKMKGEGSQPEASGARRWSTSSKVREGARAAVASVFSVNDERARRRAAHSIAGRAGRG